MNESGLDGSGYLTFTQALPCNHVRESGSEESQAEIAQIAQRRKRKFETGDDTMFKVHDAAGYYQTSAKIAKVDCGNGMHVAREERPETDYVVKWPYVDSVLSPLPSSLFDGQRTAHTIINEWIDDKDVVSLIVDYMKPEKIDPEEHVLVVDIAYKMFLASVKEFGVDGSILIDYHGWVSNECVNSFSPISEATYLPSLYCLMIFFCLQQSHWNEWIPASDVKKRECINSQRNKLRF